MINPKRYNRIVLCGYSWGGGAIMRSITLNKDGKRDLDERLKGVEVDEAYVADPVKLGMEGMAWPASDIPNYRSPGAKDDCKITYYWQSRDTVGEWINPIAIGTGAPKGDNKSLKFEQIKGVTHNSLDDELFLKGKLPVGPNIKQ